MRWTVVLAFVVLAGAVGYVAARYLLPLLLPFLIAWLLSLLVVPAARRIAERMHVSQRICATMLLTLQFVLLGFLLWGCVRRLTKEVQALFEAMMTRYGSLDAMLAAWDASLENMLASLGWMKEGMRESISTALYRGISAVLSGLLSRLPEWMGALLSAVPSVFLGALVTVVASFYFCLDPEGVSRGLTACLPLRIRRRIPAFHERIRRISWRYLRAYLILLVLTLTILFVGFLCLRIPYAFLLACLIALLDMLPVLGVGTVLFPWAGVLLLQKSYYRGFGLLILYCVAVLTRQIAEPRLIGKSLGLHPLLTVFATYVGFSLFGVIGMLLAPFFALLARVLLLHGQEETRKKIDKPPSL